MYQDLTTNQFALPLDRDEKYNARKHVKTDKIFVKQLRLYCSVKVGLY